MKYNEQLALAYALAEKLELRIEKDNLPDYIVAMPLHPAKLRERGFNQSQLLATVVVKYFRTHQ